MKTLLLLLLVLLGVALGVQRTVGTKTGIPEAGHAVMQEVLAERRKAAMASQETNQGYVIDPALAAFVEGDAAQTIGLADDAFTPTIGRAWGLRVRDGHVVQDDRNAG